MVFSRIAISARAGIKSFADDLAVRNGPVSSRVALLLRSAEGKPSFASILGILSSVGRPVLRLYTSILLVKYITMESYRCWGNRLEFDELGSYRSFELLDAEGHF